MKNLKRKKGFALLYAILLTGAILTIGVALMNIITKELIYSSVSRNSEVSFYYIANSGKECLLYHNITGVFAPYNRATGKFELASTGFSISCFGQPISMTKNGAEFIFSGNIDIDGQSRLVNLSIYKNIPCLNDGDCSGPALKDRFGTVIRVDGFSGVSGSGRLTKRTIVSVI
jgi:hypothetical protein